MEDKEFKKRDLDEINFNNGALTDKSKIPFLIFDFIEDPYTMIYLKFVEKVNEKHLMILKLILRKLDKKKLTIDLNIDPIVNDINLLMSIRMEILTGIDYMKDINFKKQSNLIFIESIESNGDTYRFKISKDFYKAITKYFVI
ncbi:hypothetical protein [Clostridium sp. Marseille-Q2269]|uniref:hypothetical protein n=1 Tax=Clostridium sp. Marseille-Q2269 TaxID=2942205 RepID=UPI002072C3C4|nr:hypothetical protein [Clostridium sp. Marseille-Q2269]